MNLYVASARRAHLERTPISAACVPGMSITESAEDSAEPFGRVAPTATDQPSAGSIGRNFEAVLTDIVGARGNFRVGRADYAPVASCNRIFVVGKRIPKPNRTALNVALES